jgi:hypothetical protein
MATLVKLDVDEVAFVILSAIRFELIRRLAKIGGLEHEFDWQELLPGVSGVKVSSRSDRLHSWRKV